MDEIEAEPRRRRGGYTRMTRRSFLKTGAIIGGVAVAAPSFVIREFIGPSSSSAASVITFPDWSRTACVAGADFQPGDADAELQAIVNDLAAQNVTVIEIDTILSEWLTDAQFAQAMADAARFNAIAHAAGLKAVWYYPSLEVLSIGGLSGPSMYKTNPDWVQVNIEGEPNVFYGNVEFWVGPDDESAWMSPNGPYHDYYLNRIKLLAASGADGIWPDVPLYLDSSIQWSDASHWARDAFSDATGGLQIPGSPDWQDPAWRRWLKWRSINLSDWQRDIAAAARSVNPDCLIYAETMTVDYNNAVLCGLDGAYLRLDEDVTQTWEISLVSDYSGMRYAMEDDWICLISMFKYSRAACGAKPAWVFSYGKNGDDASLVMAEALAAGCNPFEAQVESLSQTCDAAMRTRMYGFVKDNAQRIFNRESLARVAVYHSSASRDYLWSQNGDALYCTTTALDGRRGKWWSTSADDSCYIEPWLGEYRGTVKALVHAHLPFDLLTSPTFRAEDLTGYGVLMLPNLQAVSDDEANIIREFVRAGGMIIITGPNPMGLNEYGDTRAEYALADVLGITKGAALPASKQNTFGSGEAYFYSDLPGKNYLKNTTPADFDKLIVPIQTGSAPFVTTDANRRVHLEAGRVGDDIILQFTNFMGVNGADGFSSVPTTFNISVNVPPGKRVTAVELCSPDNATPDLQPLAFTISGQNINFTVTNLMQYSLVVVSTSSTLSRPFE